jgi:tape measure domain-containing protein
MTTEVRRVNVEMANLRHLAAQAGTALAVAFSARAVVQLGASVLDAGRQMESLTHLRVHHRLQHGRPGRIPILRQISDDLGQNFYVLADAYRGIGAAAKGTALEGQSVRDIFVAMTEASSVLGMSADSTNLAMKAIAQIMSKGKLSAEELRQQIGDHLYGAFNKAAEAMGVTTIQLEEMLQKGLIPADKFIPRFAIVLHEDFGPTAREAATGAQAATNKFREAWMDLKVSMAESGFLDSAVASMRDLTGMLQDQGVREGMRDFATLLGEIARMGASVAVELGRIGAAFNGLPPAMRGALLGAIGGGLVGFGLAGKTGALVLGGGGALLGMVAGGNASNREEVQRGMRRGAMEQRTQALIHGDVSGTVLAEGALAAEFELQAQAGSGGGGGGGGGGDGGGGGGKAKPNYEEMLRAAKDFHSAMRIMDAQALEQWKGDAAVRVDAWKAAYEAIQDITGQHVDAEVAMLRQAQDAVLSHLADNEENRLRVRAYFSQQTLDVYEREIENLQRLAINFAEFYQLELAKRSKDDERFVAHQRETWEKASKVLIELNGIDIQEDRRSLDEQYKYVREGAEDKGAADIWYQQQIQELRAKELERAEKYASDMGAVYRARVEKQLSLAASGGEEERRIWAELAEQQARLSDEVYAARAEMYKRIVAAPGPPGWTRPGPWPWSAAPSTTSAACRSRPSATTPPPCANSWPPPPPWSPARTRRNSAGCRMTGATPPSACSGSLTISPAASPRASAIWPGKGSTDWWRCWGRWVAWWAAWGTCSFRSSRTSLRSGSGATSWA